MSTENDPQQQAESIAQTLRKPQLVPFRVLLFSVVVLLVLGLLLVARVGSDFARIAAVVGVILSFAIFIAMIRFDQLRHQDIEQSLARTLGRLDPELAGRVTRAYRLFRNTLAHSETASYSETASAELGGTTPSLELARLHASRLLGRVELGQVERVALQTRVRLQRATLVVLGFCLAAGVFWSLALFEGLDVLLARRGVGPFPIAYVEELEIAAEWPSYLDGAGERKKIHGEFTGVPEGSEIEVRVLPRVHDRKLLLTDGKKSVPLVSDGQGALVARWIADDPARLKVAAQFGDVLLFDVHQTAVQPLADRAPIVRLEGAPKTIQLAELERLELRFLASDDHGLGQVELVLQSGQRNVRTELARLDAHTRLYRGSHALSREHELLRRAFLPVHVRVEARDGNTATGPAWGKSDEIILMPEPLGKVIATRHIALRSFRASVSGYFAAVHEAGYQKRELQAELTNTALARLQTDLETLRAHLESDPSGPLRSLAFIQAQVEALGRTGRQRTSPEAVLLAVDALIHGLSQKEATQLAQDLGQSVEEIAVQARQLRFDPTSISLDGLRDLVTGNQAGAAQLSEVGILGLDLGSVAKADLFRIESALKERGFDRAEAAALHLAERLKRATPSFSSSGGGGAGVESGTPSPGRDGKGQPGPSQSTSDASSEFDKLAQQLGELAQQGEQELSELDQLLKEAVQALNEDFQKDPALDAALLEAKAALNELPEVGRGTGSASSEAASARSQGEAMAEALESGEFEEGVERGRDAERALHRAAALLEQGFGYVDAASLKRAEVALAKVIELARRVAEQKKSVSAALDRQAQRERGERQRDLAERAKQLAEQGVRPQSALPKDNIDHLNRAARLLDHAAQALEEGQGERSRQLASEAQGHLEQAAFETQDQDPSSAKDGSGKELDLSGQVPDQERDRAKDFLERVEQGLSRGSGRLAPAVRRYAEDLK